MWGGRAGTQGGERGLAAKLCPGGILVLYIDCVCGSEAVLAAGLAAMAAVLDADSRVRDGIRSARFLDTLTNSVRYNTLSLSGRYT